MKTKPPQTRMLSLPHSLKKKMDLNSFKCGKILLLFFPPRKYRLKAENEARQNWAQNWGFLSTPFEEVNVELMTLEVIDSRINGYEVFNSKE